MWVAKISVDAKDGTLGSRTKKFKITLFGYPVSSYAKKDGVYLYIAGSIVGEDNNKKEFLESLKKDRNCINLEVKGNFLICQVKQPPNSKILYQPNIIHLEPVMICQDGTAIWTVGCWNKNHLMDFVRVIRKVFGESKLLSIKEEKVSSFTITSIQPELTDKQKKAVEIAVNNDYYNYPRSIKLKKLAGLMHLSYSTYQAHLRKAEQKLIPFMFKKTK